MTYEPSAGWPAGVAGAPEAARRRGAGPGKPDDAAAEERPADDPAAWAERFRAALEESAARERRREVTVVGPHRDEVAFTGQVAGDEERELRTYGSGGQQRTASLALRLVEADSRRERLGRDPVYLLDDVFAELDRDRAGSLIRLLDEGRDGQVVVTSPKPSDLGLRGGGLETWTIRDGELET
jgi:DNA replication and repair protein RecF